MRSEGTVQDFGICGNLEILCINTISKKRRKVDTLRLNSVINGQTLSYMMHKVRDHSIVPCILELFVGTIRLDLRFQLRSGFIIYPAKL
jgi:hypothetical protein